MPDLPGSPPATPADATEREAALDITRSVIVQAPAGSGKTDLLTRRYLRLLAVVDEPEEILAITFTRAATAEMRARVLSDLEAAAGRRPGPDDAGRMALALAALAHAERREWNILDHPQRLSIETIDSLCLNITRGQPLLAGLSSELQPTDTPEPLYTLAARRTLERLGGADPSVDAALAYLLELRDNRLSDCQSLLAQMLASRDRWAHAFPLSGDMREDDWDNARIVLEIPFHHEIRRVLDDAYGLLADQRAVSEQILQLAQYALANGNEKLAALAGVLEFSPAMSVEHWQCICELLLRDGKVWRKTVNVRQGFPSNTKEEKSRKTAMTDLLHWLEHTPRLLAALSAIRSLPPAHYSDAQWATLRNVFTVLRQSIAELHVVFAETGSIDFTELGLAALHVLQTSPDRTLALGGRLRHLLVDEFQDTSRRQHELVAQLLSVWETGEGRTAFLVGDPMQSIYMFRQAEVELFAHVRDHGIRSLEDSTAVHIPCDNVQLSVNFRSHAGLTEPINRMFEAICADATPPGAASVPFVRAVASEAASPQPALHVHPQIIGSADRKPTRDEQKEAQNREALEMLRILESHRPRMERALETGEEYRVAVLVRARPHLAQLVPLLRREQIPFRAVEIERLSERQEMLDLLALTRALLHPMDRIAWLSVLRAPWCGLRLADLHRLTGSDDRSSRYLSILELIDRNQSLLSEDGRQRLARTSAILHRALDLRWRLSESPSFSSWIERTWRTLGGPACVDAAGYENAQVFFSMLDAVSPDGLAPGTAEFMAEFNRLFAQPDPAVSEQCGVQLMTIHKAKGLGFDVVVVPGLDRGSSADDSSLIVSLERINPWHSGETEFLVAPLGASGDDTDPLFKWVRKQRQIRFDEERKRLLYVACTRGRNELHLLGTAQLSASGVRPENKQSLLAVAWPALHEEFAAAARAPQPATPARVLAFPTPGVLADIAAAADPLPILPLRRLPLDFATEATAGNVTSAGTITLSDPEPPEFRRPEGSRERRVVGSAVHALLQRLGPALQTLDPAGLRARAASLLRAAALTGESLRSATDTVTNLLLACAADPICQWILAPHPEAQSEASWSGTLPGEATRLRTLRADRIFRAGSAPLADGSDYFWIVDYKTGAATPGALFLAAERALYEPQLNAYARVLRALHGTDTPLRLGLYYPAIATLDWWEIG